MGWAGGVYEGEERCIEDIGGKTRKKETRGVYGRIILKLIFKIIIGVVIAQTGWTVRG
jgi:hypothetical protein